MKKLCLIIFACVLSQILLAQELSKQELRYKPKTLDEAIEQLKKIHDDSVKSLIIDQEEQEFLANAHFGLGMWMRNKWGLWKGSELAKHFNEIGIFHPDDMSGVILTSYYRDLTGQERELEIQIKYYRDYWKAVENHQYKVQTDPEYVKQIERERKEAEEKYWEELRAKFSINDKISAYIDYQCGFLSGGMRTKIEGTVLEVKDKKVKIKISKYLDESKKRKAIKCNDVQNEEVWANIVYCDLIE